MFYRVAKSSLLMEFQCERCVSLSSLQHEALTVTQSSGLLQLQAWSSCLWKKAEGVGGNVQGTWASSSELHNTPAMEKSASLETIPMLGVKVCPHLPHYIPSPVSVDLSFFLSRSPLSRSLHPVYTQVQLFISSVLTHRNKVVHHSELIWQCFKCHFQFKFKRWFPQSLKSLKVRGDLFSQYKIVKLKLFCFFMAKRYPCECGLY